MPERIYNEVIVPFLSVVENPTQREDLYNLETKLINEGKLTEEERYVWPNNKLIALSSASYKFEYMYKLYTQFENLIFNQSSTDTAHRTIMQFSYDCAPKQLYDQNLINQMVNWIWTTIIMFFYIIVSIFIVSKYLQKFSNYKEKTSIFNERGFI